LDAERGPNLKVCQTEGSTKNWENRGGSPGQSGEVKKQPGGGESQGERIGDSISTVDKRHIDGLEIPWNLQGV